MNRSTLRKGCVAIALLSPITLTMHGAERLPKTEQGHVSGIMAKITLPGGAARTARLEGVGCAASICSRTAIKGGVEHAAPVSAWLDSIAAIRDITETAAVFVMKDGTERRLALMKDFRVLYLTNESGDAEKLDLAKLKSIELLSPSR